MIIVEGWGDEQGEFDISISGEFLNTDNVENKNISVYPNPANNFIYLQGIPSQEINIHNAMGKLVQKSNYIKNNQISTSNLSAGFYIVSFRIDNKLKSKTLIIE